jgi:uncharacterized protein YjbI with pentapeptide repeats
VGKLYVQESGERLERVAEDRFASIAAKNIRGKRITGRPQAGQTFRGNFVECRLKEIIAENIDFGRCDWKDCKVTDSRFVDCHLGEASMITNDFESCEFVRCKFTDTSVSDSSFLGCTFKECDFRDVIIKASRFDDVTFDECLTSNRLIESSLLLRTAWRRMEMDFAIVTGNFGLRRADLIECEFSDTDRDPEARAIALPTLSALERFRIAYFECGSVDADPAALEAALDLRNWGTGAFVQGSVGLQISGLSQFLLALYEREEIAVYPVILLHSNNFRFLEIVAAQPHAKALYQIIAGVHLALTRVTDEFAVELTAFTKHVHWRRRLHLAALGPADVAHFEKWLNEQGVTGVEVVSVRPRNSPVELVVQFVTQGDFIAFAALLAATRTKMELTRLGAVESSQHGNAGQTTPDQAMLSFSAGFSLDHPSVYELNVQTLLPRSLLLDLRLGLSVRVFSAARRVLVDLLSDNPRPAGHERAGTLPPPE